MQTFLCAVDFAALLLIFATGNTAFNSSDNYVNGSRVCFNQTQSRSLTFLQYSGSSKHSVKIPYPLWTSAQVNAYIYYILLREKMFYSADLVRLNTLYCSDVVNYVAGCLDPEDSECVERDVDNPIVHFTVESWTTGTQRVAALPESVKPALLSVLSWKGDDTLFLWQDTVDAGLNSPARLSLDFYRDYNASEKRPHVFFDSWQKMLSLIPSELVVPCSEMGPGSPNDRQADLYVQFTGDTDLACHHNDTVWFSPRCRAQNSTCVPTLVPYFIGRVMQLAFFLDMPLAVILVLPGQYNYREYHAAIRSGHFLFSYWIPDDALVDGRGRLPVALILPPQNQLEQDIGLYRTGDAQIDIQNYGWPQLAQVTRAGPPPRDRADAGA